ncbi:MAG: hypothetical protein LBV57_03725 [Candidatus Symbiothrix sp.]|jgi:hypothetical protein|nr:hypothetical protein [Candidatus Symbiothrix sp.]
MSKLYVFGIGGTGSRVIKSLVMLMASGVKLNVDELVPVIIDPDHAAADLTRTVRLLQQYKRVRNHLDFHSANQNTFFHTDMNLEIIPSVTLPIMNTRDIDFKDYIGLSLMTDKGGDYDANYALASMLFSEKNLNAKMDVGFKGNPNIGSVVLNQFAETKEFIDFAASFDQGDRIFIVSSIFGGTGASGFPLLLKNIRAISADLSGNGNVKDAPVGAISVLPYFDVAPDHNLNHAKRSQIDSSTFISKTKAALSYYDRNINEANVLYYIADYLSKQYANSEGGATQKNDAHFIELAAALAIVDFASIPAEELITNHGVPQQTMYKEFGTENSTYQLIFNDLSQKTNDIILKPLTRFVLFCKYLQEQLSDSYKQPWTIDHDFDEQFFHAAFFQSELLAVKNAFIEWLYEMGNNSRAFAPYDLAERKSDLFALIRGLNPAKLLSLKSNYALFDDVLNDKQKDLKKDTGKEQRFVELFSRATDQLLKLKFRI